jgi:hypothetical protein
MCGTRGRPMISAGMSGRCFTLAGGQGWRLGSQRRLADDDAAGRVR